MPHFNRTESEESKSSVTVKKNNSTPGGSPESIPSLAPKDSITSPMNGVDQLLSVAATATKQQPDERRSPEECTPSHPSQKQMITPSPLIASREQGPMLSIYGNSRIYTSPIRVKNRSLISEAVKQQSDASLTLPTMKHPSNLRYGSPSSLASPPPRRISYARVSSYDEQSDKKRCVESPDNTEMVKRARTAKSVRVEVSSVKETAVQKLQELNSSEQTESTIVVPAGPKKKAIISPSHSGEKGEADESNGPAHQGATYPLGARPYPHAPYLPPHMHPYGMRSPYGAPMPPPCGNGHPMYSSYPPPPPHYMDGRHVAPPSYYSPYPPHPVHPMMHHYRHPSQLPPPYNVAPPPAAKGAAAATSVKHATPTNSPKGDDEGNSIKSVAEWRRAALATGKAPSANRCLPLQEPIPSKYWGEAEKTKDATLPDFHRLVNFPDYLAKPRAAPDSASSTTNGKKNCVMCGKLRVCSASNFRGGRKPEDANPAKDVEDDQGCAHIIPRQNKGLCTACDITVWVVVGDGLEIKWCKGCKNFRPWAAFGDKGSATKCVRCRDRQREKYALQKSEIRTRPVRTSSPDSTSSSSAASLKAGAAGKQERKEDATYLAAASGLHHLMNAATSTMV